MILLDTSAIIELVLGTEKGKIIQENLEDDVGATSSLTAHELLAGASETRTVILKNFLRTLEIIPFNLEDSYKSSELEKKLSKKGKTIGKVDVLIAGTCLARNIKLITTDTDFARVDDLKIILV
ncbi:type II toxin-antitoxin system VapC family toxin [archaeon]|nr:type II toxin-antitoxin system VapC family toxin [archaeon]